MVAILVAGCGERMAGTMNGTNDHPATQPAAQILHPFGRRVWLWYPAVILGAVVSWGLLAPFIGMGTAILAILLYLATVTVLIVVGIAVFGIGPFRISAVVICTIPGVWLLFQAETFALTKLLLRFPLPRPMFHNRFDVHERVLLPFWQRPYPLANRVGHWVWTDWNDNVLVLIAAGNTVHAVDPIRTGQNETEFKVGDKGAEKYVAVKRTRDSLVVILPHGEMQSFHLRPDVVRAWEADWRTRPAANLLQEVVALLTPGQDEPWNSFLAGYTEPTPEQRPSTTSGPATPISP
jgi:hypothetical protein